MWLLKFGAQCGWQHAFGQRLKNVQQCAHLQRYSQRWHMGRCQEPGLASLAPSFTVAADDTEKTLPLSAIRHATVIPRLTYPAPSEPGSQAPVGIVSSEMGDLSRIRCAVVFLRFPPFHATGHFPPVQLLLQLLRQTTTAFNDAALDTVNR